ncbi:MAG: aminopeptidase P family protein [Bdellovibrionota bacterium]
MIFSPGSITERKRRTALALNTVLKDEDTVLVYSGTPIQKPGGHDQTYMFLPHPDYFWISGSRRPYGVSAYSKTEGWIDFVLPVTREEKIWEGGADVIPGKDLADFSPWMDKRDSKRVFNLTQESDELEWLQVKEIFSRERRIKDAEEVDLILKLASIANAGYQKLKTSIRPGLTERQIQLDYETAVLYAGSEKFPYDSIVGTGSHSATLHAIPTSRIVKDTDHVLIDAGADLHDYCVDITRIFPANGKKSDRLKTIYDLVLKAQTESIAMCVPGTKWKDVHLKSARVMAQGLIDLGILKVNVEEAIQNNTISVFFPHGVGHMVGLRVRDVGGPYNPDPKKYAGARLRVDMVLEENHLMTVEPGLYFIEALLHDAETRRKFGDQVNWTEAEKWLDFGGVRIEDDILVTSRTPKNLTEVVEK